MQKISKAKQPRRNDRRYPAIVVPPVDEASDSVYDGHVPQRFGVVGVTTVFVEGTE